MINKLKLKKTLLALVFLLSVSTFNSQAFTATVTSGTGTLYLRVGDGAFTRTLNSNGSPRNLATINVVSTSLTGAEVINQAINNTTVVKSMTTNGSIGTSHWDGYTFCNIPQELYIGGYYRRPNNSSSAAILTATVPSSLINETGQTIPFSRISWTSSGNGDTGAQPFPANTFVNGGTQTIGNIAVNRWAESCHSFSYSHNGFIASGTYTGRVTYTLATP